MNTLSTRTLAVYCLLLSQPLILIVGFIDLYYCSFFGTDDCVMDMGKSLAGIDLGLDYPIRVTLLATLKNLCMLFFIFGLWFIHSKMKEDEKGYALTRLGLLVIFVGFIFSAFYSSHPVEVFYNLHRAMLVSALGLIIFSLGISTREEHNKTLAYVVAVMAFLSTVIFIGVQLLIINVGVSYIWMSSGGFVLILYQLVLIVWSVTLGLKLRKAA